MPFYKFYCESCDFEETRKVYIEDKIFKESILVKSLSEEEEKKLPPHEDPRDYKEYKIVEYGESSPEKIECSNCKKTAHRSDEGIPVYKYGRNSYEAMNERRRYAYEGMDKQQAEKFYKESIEASKERVKTGDQHYKRVDPNYKVLEKQGVVKRNTSERRYQKQKVLKDANVKLTREGKIGKIAHKKPTTD